MKSEIHELVSLFGGTYAGSGAVAVSGVALDSRQVEPGDLFVALPGTQGDGKQYIDAALKKGAACILVPEWADEPGAFPLWIHPEAQSVAGLSAAKIAGDPARRLDIVAITGTNGKTTTAHLLYSLLRHVGGDPALLGTTGYLLAGGEALEASHTTPDAPKMQWLLARHMASGGGTVVMEASSHALEQDRLAGVSVDVAIFTNLSRDHLDYHGNMDAYAASKARLFSALSQRGVAILNADDREHPRMARAARAQGAQVLTTSLLGPADLWATAFEALPGELRLDLAGMGLDRAGLKVPLTGAYNASNLLQALAAARWLGVDAGALLNALPEVKSAPGRMEQVEVSTFEGKVWVDYAHTPDALRNALACLQHPKAKGTLTVVFGCGGDRDAGKRGSMGEIAARGAGRIIVTSDNPRGEDPAEIAAQVVAGVELAAKSGSQVECFVELDRRKAIALAMEKAGPSDRILIAGKGHEATQVFADRTVPFDDRLVVQEICA